MHPPIIIHTSQSGGFSLALRSAAVSHKAPHTPPSVPITDAAINGMPKKMNVTSAHEAGVTCDSSAIAPQPTATKATCPHCPHRAVRGPLQSRPRATAQSMPTVLNTSGTPNAKRHKARAAWEIAPQLAPRNCQSIRWGLARSWTSSADHTERMWTLWQTCMQGRAVKALAGKLKQLKQSMSLVDVSNCDPTPPLATKSAHIFTEQEKTKKSGENSQENKFSVSVGNPSFLIGRSMTRGPGSAFAERRPRASLVSFTMESSGSGRAPLAWGG